MKTKNKLILSAVILPLIVGSASVFAYGGKDGHRGKNKCRPGIDRSVMKQLDLTQEQKDKLKDMKQANKQERKEEFQKNAEARKAYHDQIQKLVLADNFDQNAADALAKQMAEAQVQQRVEKMKQQHDMLNVLTPAQKTKYVQLEQAKMEQCRS
ncbi:CpxP family protein [Vibrio marisflavi]|uniref:Periplasmic protein CpxP n=1 Tax=Vibrio marisflavi CECT 7928 TaxID=634439 RepID=A0ABM9A922_9VIBR|nr:CpxP family protein [Vibrio marisflavi]CAH0542807.1 Periplasmic protein CpxP [Vibrio marisflavi CECT 7928]